MQTSYSLYGYSAGGKTVYIRNGIPSLEDAQKAAEGLLTCNSKAYDHVDIYRCTSQKIKTARCHSVVTITDIQDDACLDT